MKITRSYALVTAALIAVAPQVARAQGDSPRGWVGVLITTGIGQPDNSGALVFNDYPVIESIDPGSPAEKAGLQAGDILISINSQDFKKNPIPMSKLLVPGQRIVFRYRRDDVEKTSILIVAERPAGTSQSVVLKIIGPDESATRRARTEESMNRRAADRAPLPPMMTMIPPFAFGSGVPSIAIAGAELTRLNDGLRDVLKVKGNGLFVINVAMGTPAEAAGLKSGDVIVRVSKELVSNPAQLIRLMEMAENNSLMLQILRKQRAQNLVLRW